MKKTHVVMVSLALMCFAGCRQEQDKTIDEVLRKMTLEEKARIIVGTGNEGRWVAEASVGNMKDVVPGAAGTTCPIERLSIPFVILSDGPAGVNIDSTREHEAGTFYCTHFPVGTALASTWNSELVETVGRTIGDEAAHYGVDVVLGPGMNIHRHPLNGRNFEYYSEDPLLTGKTAAAMIRGIQADGVAACPKHFAANNQETNRMGNDVRVSQRALREIYLKGFEIAVREGNPKALMTSYNKINGISVSERHDLVTDFLREECGFSGVVVTDWYGGDHPEEQMKAGNDLIMPGQQWQVDSIVHAVNAGRLDISYVDQCVRRILKLVYAAPRNRDGHACDNHPDLKAHAAIARQSATEGIVLLKNDKQALPIAPAAKEIALFGCASYDYIPGGSGSGDVRRAYTVSILQGLQNAGYGLDPQLASRYADFIGKSIAAGQTKVTARFADMVRVRPDEMPLAEAEIAAQARRADYAVITLGRTCGEYYDRTSSDFELSPEERALLENVCRIFHAAGKRVAVVLNIGGVVETASWKHLPDAILCAWQLGQEGGNSVADVLSGRQSPSGKLPMTFPVRLDDIGANANFPVDQTSDVVSMASRRIDRGERNVDYTCYEEGIYVGYRWFDSRQVEVSYPFGYGLSYTTFAYSDLKVQQGEEEITVSVDITNSGTAEGREVVQLYVSAPAASMDKPAKELKAFAKTASLTPGEKATVSLVVKVEDLRSYDEGAKQWKLEPGTYKVMVASSSRDIQATESIEIENWGN
ncbi:MAG: glycoside hydrolase family 3 C-terminal domain-containing protein [Bacteroidales bacterium]|nr:glycoside hydrolase family 3 C-terminal domain-containing protein [Bacteroidales bacterium]